MFVMLFMLGISSTAFAGEWVGDKYCQTLLGLAHNHQWTATSSQKVKAMADAVDGWTYYTRIEYGAHWADFSHAINGKVKCSQSGSQWSCTAKARPCRK